MKRSKCNFHSVWCLAIVIHSIYNYTYCVSIFRWLTHFVSAWQILVNNIFVFVCWVFFVGNSIWWMVAFRSASVIDFQHWLDIYYVQHRWNKQIHPEKINVNWTRGHDERKQHFEGCQLMRFTSTDILNNAFVSIVIIFLSIEIFFTVSSQKIVQTSIRCD